MITDARVIAPTPNFKQLAAGSCDEPNFISCNFPLEKLNLSPVVIYLRNIDGSTIRPDWRFGVDVVQN